MSLAPEHVRQSPWPEIESARSNRFFLAMLALANFSWLVNFKLPLAGDGVYLSFLVCYVSFPVVIVIMLLSKMTIRSSSLAAACLVSFVVSLTTILRAFGFANEVSFEHLTQFPWGAISKLVLVLLSFVATNEMLANGKIRAKDLLRLFAISVLLSLGKYYFDSFDLIINSTVNAQNETRPYPEWIGGWNSYAFLLSLAFLIIYYGFLGSGPPRMILLIVVFVTILSTLSRAGLGALLLALGADWLALQRHLDVRKRVSSKGTLYMVLFLIVLVPILVAKRELLVDRFFRSFFESQYEGVNLLQSITSGRTVQWLDTIIKISDSNTVFQWFFGYGVGHYAWDNSTSFETEMHNQYLLFVYEYGIPIGLIMSALLVRTLFVLSWKSVSPLDRMVRAAVLIFVTSCVVEGFIYTTQIGWVLGMLAAIVLRMYKRQRSAQRAVAGPAKPLTPRI